MPLTCSFEVVFGVKLPALVVSMYAQMESIRGTWLRAVWPRFPAFLTVLPPGLPPEL